MTTVEAEAARIFADARVMSDAAIERLAAGDLRDAAEKAWCATLRATEALVLARTGQRPGTSTQASRRLGTIADADPSVRELEQIYYLRQGRLHGDCFYHEICPMPGTERLIHETSDFNAKAQGLANGPTIPPQNVGL